MHLFIIDGIGPFFIGYKKRRVNWSKIPFENLEDESGALDQEKCTRIAAAFERFCAQVVALGYNVITLDDLAHLADFSFYPPSLRRKISAYQDFYRRLFSVASEAGLSVYLTTDIMFGNDAIARHVGSGTAEQTAFLREAIVKVFDMFETVGGIVTRMGERDANDYTTDFRSWLAIRRPSQVRSMLRGLLPEFEKRDKQWVFRTWSVGVYRIGDLIWNRDTFDRSFGKINSPNLALSMKYGESDFFRFLSLNRLFFRSSHRKIIELQARREYEGFGRYPSFIGWDYENYRNQLKAAPNMVGMSVWCQTGGWGMYKSLTYVEGSSLWNEINTYVAAKLFRDGCTADGAIRSFFSERFNNARWDRLYDLLKLSDEVVKELLYIDDFARRKVFFRRLRVPPMLAVYWDHIIINHSMRKILRCFVLEGENKIQQGYDALAKIDEMICLAREIGIDIAGLEFQRETFEILAVAREYYFRPFSCEVTTRLEGLLKKYRHRYYPRYEVHLDFSQFRLKRARLRLLLKVLLRQRRGYRNLDRIFTINFLSLIYPLLRRFNRHWVPEFAQHQAMGLDSVFR